jgi:hypothetical protein
MFGALYFGGGYFGDLFGLNLSAVAETAMMVVEAELAGFGLGWTAIYEDLASPVVDFTRGFQSDQPDDLVAAPAMCSFTMRDDANTTGGLTGYYAPDNPNCRPGWAEAIRVRFRLRAGVTLRTRFIGFIQHITPTLGLFNEQTVGVSAASWLALASTTLAAGVSPQFNQRGDQLVATLTALSQFPPPATSFSAGADTFPIALDDLDPTQATVVDGFDSTVRSGFDRVWERADGTLVYEPKAIRRANPSSLFVVTDVAPVAQPGFALVGGSLTRELGARINRAQITGHPRAIDASAVVLYSYPISASNPSVAAGATVTIRAPYVDPSQQAQQVGGFNMLVKSGAGSAIGTQGPCRTPTSNSPMRRPALGTTCPASSPSRSSTRRVRRRSRSPMAAHRSAYYAKLQCRGQGIYDYVQAVGSAMNSTSISQFGGQTLSIDCPYQTDQTFLQTLAAYIVEVYGVALSRFDQGIPFFVHAGDTATLDQLLAREISDPIGVTETVCGITAGPYWINSIHEQYDERCNLTLTWGIGRRFSAPASQVYGAAQTATPFDRAIECDVDRRESVGCCGRRGRRRRR